MKGRAMAALFLGIVTLAVASASDKFGTVGVTYTVASNTVRYTFRLDSAVFATEYSAKDAHVFAPRGRKLLLVRYTVGNPQSWSLSVPKDLVRLGVIEDPTKTPGLGGARTLEFAGQTQDLGAGKSFSETAYLEVANENQTPQLLVAVGGSPENLRYDLSARVKALTGPFALQHGLVAADDVVARLGESVPAGAFEIAIEKATLGRTPIRIRLPGGINDEITPAAEQRILVVSIRLKNRTKSDQSAAGAVFTEVFDETGMKGPIHTRVLSKDNAILEGAIKPGATATVQIVFLLPREFNPTTITVYDEVGGRRSVTVRNFVR